MQIAKITVNLELLDRKVTRVIEVPMEIRLDEFHEVLITAFGWFGGHLYSFWVGAPYHRNGFSWGHPEFAEENGEYSSEDYTLAQMFEMAAGRRITYVYDFGDDWRHKFNPTKPKEAAPDTVYPRLIKAVGRCPPEDVGGPWGYEDFLDALADPNHENHEMYTEWRSGSFDPDDAEEEHLKRSVASLAERLSGQNNR